MTDDTSLTGAWPIDPDTTTGLFRTELGDVVGTPHTPSDNKAEYEYLGDVQIAALITAYPLQRDMAMAKARESMATQMIAAAEDIQVDDIRIKTVERAKLMLEQARAYFTSGAGIDALSSFGVVPLVSGDSNQNVQGVPDRFYAVG